MQVTNLLTVASTAGSTIHRIPRMVKRLNHQKKITRRLCNLLHFPFSESSRTVRLIGGYCGGTTASLVHTHTHGTGKTVEFPMMVCLCFFIVLRPFSTDFERSRTHMDSARMARRVGVCSS